MYIRINYCGSRIRSSHAGIRRRLLRASSVWQVLLEIAWTRYFLQRRVAVLPYYGSTLTGYSACTIIVGARHSTYQQPRGVPRAAFCARPGNKHGRIALQAEHKDSPYAQTSNRLVRHFLISSHQLRYAARLCRGGDVKPIGSHDCLVVVLVGLSQLRGHGHLVIQIGEGAVRIQRSGIKKQSGLFMYPWMR